YEVVIVGKPDADDTKTLIKALNSKYIPKKIVLFKPTDKNSPKITALAPFTKAHVCIDGKATAYICKNYVCELPTTEIGEMMGMLSY
ncbi:thioredoxin domain-containing protein, partial [bacterium]|nr:thioredoxin domain-containing protein [bacterium]